MVLTYHKTFCLLETILRCLNSYGVQIPLRDDHCLLYGNDANARDWLYVEDNCSAIDLVVRNGKDGEVNTGGHNEITNVEVVKTMLKVLGKPELVTTYVNDRLGHDLRYEKDTTKIET